MLQPCTKNLPHTIQFFIHVFSFSFTENVVNSKMPLVQVLPGTDLIKKRQETSEALAYALRST